MPAYEPGDRPAIFSKQFQITLGVGLVLVLCAAGIILYLQRGAHIELKGSIIKIQTMGQGDDSALAIVYFRFANPADYAFVVRTVDVTATGPDGQELTSTPVSEVDAKRIFEYYTELGPKLLTTLIPRDKIPAKTTQDRMIVARFEVPVAKLDARKNLKVRIEDVDGPVSELTEK